MDVGASLSGLRVDSRVQANASRTGDRAAGTKLVRVAKNGGLIRGKPIAVYGSKLRDVPVSLRQENDSSFYAKSTTWRKWI